MQSRHHLEKALFEAIKLHYNDRANKLIDLLLEPQPLAENHSPNLHHIYQDGKSYLFIAFEYRNKIIANRLLTLFENNQDIIFAKTTKSQFTLFHAAARNGPVDSFKTLTAAAQKANGRRDDYKYWLHPDIYHNTPIITAVRYHQYDTAIYLSTLIKEEENAVYIIDQPNRFGECAIYLAFKSLRDGLHAPLIDALLTLNPDLQAKHQQKEAPFELLLQHPADQQIQLYQSLSKHNQEKLLKHYHRHIAHHLNDDQTKSIYFTISRLHSLKAHMIAKLEFDTTLPLEENFKWRTKSGTELKKSFIETSASLLTPRFTARLFEAKAATLDPPVVNIDDYSDRDYALRLKNGLLVNHDKKHLDQLIHYTHHLINQLETRGTPTVYRIFAISLPLMMIGMLLQVRSHMAQNIPQPLYFPSFDFSNFEAYKNLDCRQPDKWPAANPMHAYDPDWYSDCVDINRGARNKYESLITYTTFLMIAFTIIIPLASVPSLWFREPTLSRRESKPIVEGIENHLLNSLLNLRGEHWSNQTLIIPKLIDDVNALKSTLPKHTALSRLRSIQAALINLRGQIELTHLPISTSLPKPAATQSLPTPPILR